MSLIAVLIPLLFMGDIVGRLFREFAVTLSVTILRFGAGLADTYADDVLAVAQTKIRSRNRDVFTKRRSVCLTG